MTARTLRSGGWLLAAWLLASPAAAAEEARYPGNLDVPYVPTQPATVEAMLRIAGVGAGDFVIDLGSGDGRILITAVKKYGARGFGVDLDPQRVKESVANAKLAGVSDRAQFYQRNLFDTKIAEATVVTLYLLPQLVEKLKPRLLAQLAPGSRIVAHDFGFKDWTPDRTVNISKNYYLYVVPARVAGKWRLEAELPGGARSYDFELAQANQRVRGGARVAGGYLPAFEAKLAGDRIAFVLVENDTSHYFEGRVNGAEITGTVRSGPGRERATTRWRATRVTGVPDEG